MGLISKGPNKLTWLQTWKTTPNLLPEPLSYPPPTSHPTTPPPPQISPLSPSTSASPAELASRRETNCPSSLTSYCHCLSERPTLAFLFLQEDCQSKGNGEPQLVLQPLPLNTFPLVDILTGTGNAKLFIASLGLNFLLRCFQLFQHVLGSLTTTASKHHTQGAAPPA